MPSIYSFTAKDIDGKEVSLSQYKGKVLLIVNTATHCGFTPSYEDLEKLYQEYSKEGFEILDFPCNQFAGQAPETTKEIDSLCKLSYQTTFPRFEKVDVNGENALPLFLFLEEERPFKGFDKGNALTPVLMDRLIKENPRFARSSSIKWNFTKFLVSRDGRVLHRYEPTAPFNRIEKAVCSALDETEYAPKDSKDEIRYTKH
jgi:glutathione peroxidase